MTIRKSIRVERSPEISFKVFCEEIGRWWPRGPSFGGKELADMTIEGQIGGRFFERYVDGSEYEIGRVTAYAPPTLVAFTWRAPSWQVATQVKVSFIAEGRGTRIELEHSGWDQANLDPQRRNYDDGWSRVLEHYLSRLNAAA